MQKWISQQLTKWPVVIIGAFLHGFLSPPFNGELHWLLTPIPLIALLGILPFLYTAVELQGKQRLWRLLTWGAFHNFGTMWWLSKVQIEGMGHLLILAVFILSIIQGLWYLASGSLIGFLSQNNRKLLWLIIPSVWLVTDYTKVVGDLAFPWMFEGYYWAAFPRFSQIASITGVWGMTLFALLLVTTALLWIIEQGVWKKVAWILGGIWVFILFYGTLRLHHTTELGEYRVALVQPNFDQATWIPRKSMFEQIALNDSMIFALPKVNAVILPESGYYCYFWQNPFALRSVEMHQRNRPSTAFILGTLDYTPRKKWGPNVEVYNATAFTPGGGAPYQYYHKEVLVPFAETVPLEGVIPLLSRLESMGVSNFARGFGMDVWHLNETYYVAPTICYEGIFPNYIRKRVLAGANIVVNTTNDGWFGLSHGPYQHALMTRLRAIESGVPIIRSANSGFSFVVDSRGRYIAKGGLLTRENIVTQLPLDDSHSTVYRQWGDWVVLGAFVAVLFLMARTVFIKRKKYVTKAHSIE